VWSSCIDINVLLLGWDNDVQCLELLSFVSELLSFFETNLCHVLRPTTEDSSHFCCVTQFDAVLPHRNFIRSWNVLVSKAETGITNVVQVFMVGCSHSFSRLNRFGAERLLLRRTDPRASTGSFNQQIPAGCACAEATASKSLLPKSQDTFSVLYSDSPHEPMAPRGLPSWIILLYQFRCGGECCTHIGKCKSDGLH